MYMGALSYVKKEREWARPLSGRVTNNYKHLGDTCVHSSITHNTHKVEATQVSEMDEWVNTMWCMHTRNVIQP